MSSGLLGWEQRNPWTSQWYQRDIFQDRSCSTAKFHSWVGLEQWGDCQNSQSFNTSDSTVLQTPTGEGFVCCNYGWSDAGAAAGQIWCQIRSRNHSKERSLKFKTTSSDILCFFDVDFALSFWVPDNQCKQSSENCLYFKNNKEFPKRLQTQQQKVPAYINLVDLV